MRLRLFALLLAAFLIGTFALQAQTTASASLEGTVTDKSQAVIPGAEIKAVNRSTGLARTATSNESGVFRIELLPPGTYRITVSFRGFATSAYETVDLAVGRTTTIEAALTPSQQAETITVEAGNATLVDVQKTEVGVAIRPSEIQSLPLNGRDFANLAWLSPGARPVNSFDPTKNRTAVFATNGSNGRNVNVTVNGVDNKDNTVGGPVMQLPLEAVQEFNISTQRFSAANGRSEGAAINVITKAGSNDFHGSTYLFARDAALNTNDYFSELNGSPKPAYSRQQFGGSFGGPIRKSNDFIFFALERLREITALPASTNALTELTIAKEIGARPYTVVDTPYRDWRWSARLDHRFNDRNNAFLTFTQQTNVGLNDQSNGLNDLSSLNSTNNTLRLANATISSVLTPTIVNSFTAGYQTWANSIIGTENKPRVLFPNAVFFGFNPNIPQFSSQRKFQFRDDLSITRGAHSFKMGADIVYQPTLSGSLGNTNVTYTFLDSPSVITTNKTKYPNSWATPGALSAIAVTAGDPSFKITQPAKMVGLYFQDDWKLRKNLTINIGLRWDADLGLAGFYEQANSRTYQALKAIGSSYAGKLPENDLKDFSPRFGLAWDVKGSGKHVVRAGYGIYYGQTFQNATLAMMREAGPTLFGTVLNITNTAPGNVQSGIVPSTGQPLGLFRYGVDPGPTIPAPSTKLAAGATGNILDPLYRNPMVQQWNAGYAWQLTSSSVIEVDYVHSLALREAKTNNINPIVNPTTNERVYDSAFVAAGLPKLGPIVVAEAITRSRYDGFNVAYRKRFTNRFSIDTHYVRSRALAYNTNPGAFGATATNVLNIFASHDLGYSPNDEKHRWVGSGIVALPFGIRFAPIVQWASARPYNPVQGVDVFGYGASIGAAHAVVYANDPTNYRRTFNENLTTAQLRAGLANGSLQFTPYNALRGQTLFQFDARFSKTLTFHERYRLELLFQAFDLTDRANFGGQFGNSVRNANFGTPINYITPASSIVPRNFSGEFGARFSF